MEEAQLLDEVPSSSSSINDFLLPDDNVNLTESSNDLTTMGHKCYENGSLEIPFMVEAKNMTITDAYQVHPLGDCFYRETCYYINCSTWNGPLELTVPIYGYIMPVIITVTMISNSLIIIVLSKKHMRSPTNMVLMCMAISDLLTVIFPAPWYFYIFTLGNIEPIMNKESGYAFEVMLENLPQIFHTASNWLTMALAMQRWIYVCHVDAARVWCTMGKTRKGIAGIFIFAFLHQTTRFFDRTFENVTVEYPICSGQLINICKVSFADWVVNDVTLNGYFVTFFWFRVLFVHLIPCVSLVILNFLLFRAMREADLTRERLLKNKAATNKGESKESRKIRDSNTTTLMLIVVITVFLLVELPMGIVTILHTLSSTTDEFIDYEAARSVVLIINLCICLSYPLNFGIYCGMSRQFRETFKDLFIHRSSGRESTSFQQIEAGATRTNMGGSNSKYSLVNGKPQKAQKPAAATNTFVSNAQDETHL